MNWKRHTFIDVSDAGREAILTELAGSGPNSAILMEQFGRVILPEQSGVRVPGIVRREDIAPRLGSVPVGFSDLISKGERRLRMAAFARLEDVIKVTSPYEIISLPIPRRTAITEALAAAELQARMLGLILGVWGSAAMELYTGLPYTNKASDLDLIVAAASHEKLSCFMVKIKIIEERFRKRIDLELDLPNGYGVQLKELLDQRRTVLGKSINDVALLSRVQVLAELPA